MLSVMVPTYNGIGHPAMALDSILNRTDGNIQPVTVEEGSVDAAVKSYNPSLKACPEDRKAPAACLPKQSEMSEEVAQGVGKGECAPCGEEDRLVHGPLRFRPCPSVYAQL